MGRSLSYRQEMVLRLIVIFVVTMTDISLHKYLDGWNDCLPVVVIFLFYVPLPGMPGNPK